MIAYLLSAALLSCLGLLMYRLGIRGKASPRHQKHFILATIAASLLFPLLIQRLVPDQQWVSYSIHDLAFSGPVNHAQLQQYCQCASPNYAHRLLYRSNAFYHFLLSYRGLISGLTFLAIGGVLLKSGIQLVYLRRIVRQAKQEQMQVGNQRFSLLFCRQQLGAGAFWLGQPYVIWQPEMAMLSEGEQQAVFRHELSHIQQGNTFDKIGFRLLQCLWWFNPAFYYFRREWELLSEYLADDAALRHWPDKKAYAHLLLRLAAPAAAPFTSGLRSSDLEQRIRRMMRPAPCSMQSIVPAITLIFALQGAAVFPVSAALAGCVQDLGTYQSLVYEQPGYVTEILFCPDCETMCLPTEPLP